jgi:hypothetical protein
MSEQTYDHLEGTHIGDGEFTVDSWCAYLWADATRNDEGGFRWAEEVEVEGIDRQLVPPEYGMIIANNAIATDLDDLGLDVDMEKGAYHAGQEFEFYQPLAVDETYNVSGTLTSVERKEGSSGTFDLVTQTFQVTDKSGEPILETVSQAILMR